VSSRPGSPRIALRGGEQLSFSEISAAYLREYADKIRLATRRLDEATFWDRRAPAQNSTGNLVLHLCGNLSQWILDAVAGRRFERRRAEEFRAERTASRDELLDRLEDVVEACREAILALDEGRLDEVVEVQGYRVPVRGAVYHAVEHMSYHTGQIVLLAKLAPGDDAGIDFYPAHRDE
jgi:uncharacterized damage-inducible protein DinB